MYPVYSEQTQKWIDLLSADRNPSDMRAYIIGILEHGVVGAHASVAIYKKYAEQAGQSSAVLREGAYDFRSEMNRLQERAERYESDLKRIRISDEP